MTTLSVEVLSETPASSAMCVDGFLYFNVWTSAPTLAELQTVIDGERRMQRGYRSMDVIERMDRLAFAPGVRDAFRDYGTEVASRLDLNIVVMRAGGFAGAVIHGLVGLLNMVGLQTTISNTLDDGLALLLKDADVDVDEVRSVVLAHIARHVARVPPPGR